MRLREAKTCQWQRDAEIWKTGDRKKLKSQSLMGWGKKKEKEKEKEQGGVER